MPECPDGQFGLFKVKAFLQVIEERIQITDVTDDRAAGHDVFTAAVHEDAHEFRHALEHVFQFFVVEYVLLALVFHVFPLDSYDFLPRGVPFLVYCLDVGRNKDFRFIRFREGVLGFLLLYYILRLKIGV